MLLMYGAEVNAKTDNNQTAILLAVQNGILIFKFSLSSIIFLKFHPILRSRQLRSC